MADRKVATMKLSGNDYAKVADRLLAFRSEHPNSKIETDRVEVGNGETEFRAWIWKDKQDLLTLMMTGVTDKDILRSSADANGSAKGEVGKKLKDFEKLETVAVGRALAMVGYAGSGEIASSEEMEEFQRYQQEQHAQAVQEAVERIESAKTNGELDAIVKELGEKRLLQLAEVVAAGKKKRAEFTKSHAPAEETPNMPEPEGK